MTIPRALSYRSARSGVTLPRRSVRQNTARDGPEQRETHFRESPSHNQYHRPTGIISQRPAVWRRPGGCRHEQPGQGVGLSRYHRRLGPNTGAGDGRRAGGLSARRPMAAAGPRPSLVRCSGQLAASQGVQWSASRRRPTLWYRLGVGGHLPRPGHCQSGATAAGAAVVSRGAGTWPVARAAAVAPRPAPRLAATHNAPYSGGTSSLRVPP